MLGRFVFQAAMPAALFTMVSGARPDAFAHAPMAAFAAGATLVCALGFPVSGRLFGRGTADRAIGGMAAGYVNSANLGIPVAVQVLGDASFVAQITCSRCRWSPRWSSPCWTRPTAPPCRRPWSRSACP